ncbi:hypothetical protein JOD43_004345 [Pullulanibacillus pueri]|uniref:Uracil-DNA glycosylase-like domain-containing protein n=1 Tax=Pullulanibacillus pueri TaxID=1437324 RepID=A0A8J2ZU27_9BACL|nr:hypothetical protein [Pullulanibacillus pueri]MBM7684132.1 hypothetical protein [Pullulanibacillus pueri]GGH76732.1 hypothetical protein GCM10007096_07600 [Pullulanibacillus pueri]
MDEKYKQIISRLYPKLCIVGRDPFPKGATGIPFCKETWDVQFKKNHAGYSIIKSFGQNTENYSSPKEHFYNLAKHGIVFLNASYYFLNKEYISKTKHLDAVASSFGINKPILQRSKKILLSGKDTCTMIGWMNPDVYFDEKYTKVPHPSPQSRNRIKLKSEWDKYWDKDALKNWI